MLEQTEHFAQIIKQQIGSLDWSRKVSISYPNIQDEQDISSMNLRSYREEDKSENSETVDEDEETKVIHYSEPHRLVQSESDNVLGLKSGSEISLRISVLSNKSEDLDFSKNKIELYKLQRTREMNRISSLIAADLVEERKNQSETLNIGSMFKKLLDDNDNFKGFHIKKVNANNKIFDYTPIDDKINKDADKCGSQRSLWKISEPDKTPKSDIVNKLEKLSKWDDEFSENIINAESSSEFNNFEGHHHRRSSSNDDIGVKKVDDLDIEKLLEGDDQDELSQNEFDNDYNKLFSGNVNLHLLNEIKNIDYWNPENNYDNEQENIELLVEQQSNSDFAKVDFDLKNDEQNLNKDLSESQELKVADWADETDKLFSKSCHSELKDLLSLKRDLTSKLINSLNSKPDICNKGNNMLIFEDSNEISQDDLHIDDNKANSAEYQLDHLIDSEESQKLIDEQTEIKDQIVSELLGMLVFEVKDSLFPQRSQNYDQFTQNGIQVNYGADKQMFPK